MKPPRYQLTLHQLMVLVAFCAISFALLATAAAPVIVAIWIVLPGIAIDRARGGEGVVGGILAGGFAAVAFIWFFGYLIDDGPARRFDPFLLIFPSLLFLPFGVIFGAVVNDLVRIVPGLLKRTRSSTNEGRTTPEGTGLTSNARPINIAGERVLSSSRRERASEPCGFPGSSSPSDSTPR
jgi:hypothetical protein